MRKNLFVAAAVFISTLAFRSPAQCDELENHRLPLTNGETRPRVGLVLGGGGARGGAHVGVLKVLEEMRIPIDCIAGTSMGALVGGGYASGMSASEIENFLRNVNWQAVVGGVGIRALQSAEQKSFDDATGSVELGFKGGRVVVGSGLIATSLIEDVLRRYVAQARSVADFDKLPIPYRAVATDMLTGDMVVLDHGDIATAMRASMAIPGAFSPVVTDEYVLSDGFLVRNLPIDVARNTCADVVIVANLMKNTATREALLSPVTLVWRSNDVMSEANVRQQLQTVTSRDILIDIPVGDIGAADFSRTPDTIAIGERATRARAEQLSALAVSEDQYAVWRNRIAAGAPLEGHLSAVRFGELEHVNPEYLRTLTRVRPGDAVDIAAISQDATRMAAVDDLDGVEYQLSGDGADVVLTWKPKEKEFGPDYLRPSLGLYGGGAGDMQFELAVQHVRRWLNAFGGQWRNRFQIGSNSLVETSLYQPLDVGQTVFVEPAMLARRTLEDVYNDGERVARYYFIDSGGHLDLGTDLGRNGQATLGYWMYSRRAEVDTGVTLMPTAVAKDAGWEVAATYDTRNTASFATDGIAAGIQYLRSDTGAGADRDWQRIEAAARKAIPIDKTLLWLTVAGGTDLGSPLPSDQVFALGGPQSFRGYEPGEIRARKYWTVDSALLWRIADILPIASQTLYGGVALQGGRVYERVDPVPDGSLYGMSTYLGGQTPIGTLTIGVGMASGAWAGWITLGNPVGGGSILNQPLFR
jgi:NTE family protein